MSDLYGYQIYKRYRYSIMQTIPRLPVLVIILTKHVTRWNIVTYIKSPSKILAKDAMAGCQCGIGGFLVIACGSPIKYRSEYHTKLSINIIHIILKWDIPVAHVIIDITMHVCFMAWFQIQWVY